MKSGIRLLIIFCMIYFIRCSDYSSVFNNVIENEKIRPFGIVLDPPEAAPGDTVKIKLHFYNAQKKNITISWKISLNCYLDKYGLYTIEDEIRNLDSMVLPGGNQLEFSFIVPTGVNNPLLLSSMIPDSIPISGMGIKKSDLITMFDTSQTLSQECRQYIDNFLSFVLITATIKSNIEIDIIKKLTIRYSNKISSTQDFISNTNRNTRIDSIGIISVNTKNINNPKDIGSFAADTQYFSSDTSVVDTFIVDENHSYFLVTDTIGAAQLYRSRKTNGVLKEILYYNWFYT